MQVWLYLSFKVEVREMTSILSVLMNVSFPLQGALPVVVYLHCLQSDTIQLITLMNTAILDDAATEICRPFFSSLLSDSSQALTSLTRCALCFALNPTGLSWVRSAEAWSSWQAQVIKKSLRYWLYVNLQSGILN